ncbi:hypothetical protein QE320_gp020 [Pseudomonas phage EM]|uniref:Uncharacterized protein n=1 Tax=Pseudomonas phage EM TaxID=2936914 RepID=A0AAE9KSQ4_9CAUD|nr:hypothetical protein QE320_gp020 [Pseudomonas phage EM]UPW35822.1 hypothetical protein EM_020 [Pseudomonas phage EM]
MDLPTLHAKACSLSRNLRCALRMLTCEEIEELKSRIGANADRLIRKVERGLVPPFDTSRGRKPSFFFNAVQPEMYEVMVELDGDYPLWVDDVLQGVARLDWYRPEERSIPLSAKKLLTIFASLSNINPHTISHLLRVEARQAGRYYRAAEFAHGRLIEGFCKDDLRCMKYPETFVYPRPDIPQTDQEEG